MLENLFFALSMGFIGAAYLFVGALQFSKALHGDITFGRAAITCGPLTLSYLGVWIGGGSLLSWFWGMAGLGYLFWITFLSHHEEKKVEEELVNRELEKWGRAVADDDENAGAHLYLANALVERGDFETAAAHYRKSLELDPSNIRELMRFLAMRSSAQAEIRSRLPELDLIAREQHERDTYGRVVSGPNARPVGPLTDEEPEDEEPETPPGAPREAIPERVLLGYESAEEAYADQERQGRLSEMRRVLDDSPDDAVVRFAYAAALEEAGHIRRARDEYGHVLALSPEHADAKAALERLGEPEPEDERPSARGGSPRQRRLDHLARLKEVLQSEAGDVEPRLAYARSLEEGGLAGDARQQYERVLAQDPKNEEARAALARLADSAGPELNLDADQSAAPPRPPRERA